MDRKTGNTKVSRPKYRKLTYFFWDQRLHKVIRINRPANLVDAWDYEAHKRVAILYSDYRVKAKRAVGLGEAAKIIHCNKRTIQRLLMNEHIHYPSTSYPLDHDNPERFKTWWGEHNLLEIHDYLMTVHRGRPRKDGLITPSQKYATRAEIIAKMNGNNTLYVQGGDGSFVPVYDPPKF